MNSLPVTSSLLHEIGHGIAWLSLLPSQIASVEIVRDGSDLIALPITYEGVSVFDLDIGLLAGYACGAIAERVGAGETGFIEGLDLSDERWVAELLDTPHAGEHDRILIELVYQFGDPINPGELKHALQAAERNIREWLPLMPLEEIQNNFDVQGGVVLERPTTVH